MFPAYSYALLYYLSDFYSDDSKFVRLLQIRETCGITVEQIRAVHSAIFGWAMAQCSVDGFLDGQEREYLNKVAIDLRRLGWAPGD